MSSIRNHVARSHKTHNSKRFADIFARFSRKAEVKRQTKQYVKQTLSTKIKSFKQAREISRLNKALARKKRKIGGAK